MGNEITLKDIAAQLNVSMTTVHRAIHNKDGISPAVRSAVLAKAREMGYTTNYVASSLKRRPMTLAVVLPAGTGSGQYYYRYFWDAIQSCEDEANGLNVHIQYCAFDDAAGTQADVLQSVYDQSEGALDGLLTVPVKRGEPMRRAIERFTYSGIPVVLIDNDIPDSRRLCCVAPHDTLTGRLGAEVLCAMTHTAGHVLIAGGFEDSSAHAHNLRGFEEYLAEHGSPLVPLVTHSYADSGKTYDAASALLRRYSDIVAFYSVTARETLPLAQAVKDCGLAGKIRGVGSDLYPESAQLLKDDVVQALIYKNAYDKARRGFRVLFSYVVKKIAPPADTVTVPISIIMKNNLPFFADRIDTAPFSEPARGGAAQTTDQ